MAKKRTARKKATRKRATPKPANETPPPPPAVTPDSPTTNAGAAPLQNEIEPSRCPKCSSTGRAEYSNTTRNPIVGLDKAGNPFDAIIWRTTRCLDCQQVRRDKTYEYGLSTE